MVRVDEGRAVIDYRAPSRGRDRLILTARGPGGRTAVSRPLAVRAPVMRALGDSVTAGFGFLPSGDSMSILQLPSCIPPDVQNDRCSSNSANGPGTAGPPRYLPDWGLSNGIAWPAQFARANGLSAGTSFQNLAVSGSTPGNWGTGGALNPTLAGIVADQPDLTVMTLGANPLLDSFLFGGGLRCELTLSEAAFTACVEGFIERSDLVARVRSVIAQLLESPTNHVVVSHYHQAIPSSSVFGVPSLRIMSGLLNDAVSEAATGSPEFGERVFLMSPPLFPVGVGPGDAVCTTKSLSGLVDGESRQSRPTQDELEVVRLGDVCDTDVYWIISGDTGIHPSRLGHAQFAAALTRVVEANDLLGAGPAG
jgi:lysophospholipase L1-like esterase